MKMTLLFIAITVVCMLFIQSRIIEPMLFEPKTIAEPAWCGPYVISDLPVEKQKLYKGLARKHGRFVTFSEDGKRWFYYNEKGKLCKWK